MVTARVRDRKNRKLPQHNSQMEKTTSTWTSHTTDNEESSSNLPHILEVQSSHSSGLADQANAGDSHPLMV